MNGIPFAPRLGFLESPYGVKRFGITQKRISPGVLSGHLRAFWCIIRVDLDPVRCNPEKENVWWNFGSKIMKKTSKTKGRIDQNDDLRREYRFDYRKAQPNRFAGRAAEAPLLVMLDSDVSEVFRTPDSVNAALRALIKAIPLATKPKKMHADSERG